MPYVENEPKVLSDHEVVLEAIAAWLAVPGNGFGVTSPTLDQIGQVFRDRINVILDSLSNGYYRNMPTGGPVDQVSSMVNAAHNAFAWHVNPANGANNQTIDHIDITYTGYDLDRVEAARFYFALTRIFLLSGAISLEDCIALTTAGLTYQATVVGNLDNKHEYWLGFAGMMSNFLLWLSLWQKNGSPRVEWEKARTAGDGFEQASLIFKHLGSLGEMAAMGALAWYGSESDGLPGIHTAGACLIAASTLRHNKAVVLQLRKGVDIAIQLVFALMTLVLMFFGLIAGVAGAAGGWVARHARHMPNLGTVGPILPLPTVAIASQIANRNNEPITQ